jgi:hypothetical protein
MNYIKIALIAGGKRFLRGGIAGAVAAMLMIPTPVDGDIHDWILELGVAGLVGLITGGLMAIDKVVRMNPETE